MRRWVVEVFDDMVYGTTKVYSSTRWNKLLAEPEQLVVQAVADQTGGTSPTVRVELEHSTDQINWALESTLFTASTPPGTTTSLFGSDDGATPGGGFARLAVSLTGTTPSAHLTITVCGRNGATS